MASINIPELIDFIQNQFLGMKGLTVYCLVIPTILRT